MDRGVRIGAADGSPAGPAHAPRPHPGDERRKLPVERQQAPTPREASLLVTVCFTAPICRVGFRSGLSAPRKAGRRPTLQPPPQIPQSKPQLPRKWSTLSPLQWSIFTPPLTGPERSRQMCHQHSPEPILNEVILGEEDHLGPGNRDYRSIPKTGTIERFFRPIGILNVPEDRKETMIRVEHAELGVAVFKECRQSANG